MVHRHQYLIHLITHPLEMKCSIAYRQPVPQGRLLFGGWTGGPQRDATNVPDLVAVFHLHGGQARVRGGILRLAMRSCGDGMASRLSARGQRGDTGSSRLVGGRMTSEGAAWAPIIVGDSHVQVGGGKGWERKAGRGRGRCKKHRQVGRLAAEAGKHSP